MDEKNRKWTCRFLDFAAGMIFMLITPFLMTIYAGAMLVTRTQFALPVVAAFLAMFGVMILKEQQISDVRPENRSGTGKCADGCR